MTDYGQPVRFGVFLTPEATGRPLKVGGLADELGFDVLGIQDHPYQRRFVDTWMLLAAIAVRTERITLFPDVANLPLRPPTMMAKAAASLDILSGGRFELGLGAGGFWDAIKAYGGPVRNPGESVAAVEEAIQVLRLMWSGERGIKFDGDYYQVAGAHSGPLPAHSIGIWIGAYRPRMLSLIGRLADGWVPTLGYLKPPDLLEANGRIAEAARAAGRDPRAISAPGQRRVPGRRHGRRVGDGVRNRHDPGRRRRRSDAIVHVGGRPKGAPGSWIAKISSP